MPLAVRYHKRAESELTVRYALLALAILPTVALAAERLPPKGMPFEQARAQLLAQGFEPDKNIDGGLGCSIGFEDVCKTYIETYSCSGTGLALCQFVYWKDEGYKTVMLTTAGEENRRVYSVRILSNEEASKLYHQ